MAEPGCSARRQVGAGGVAAPADRAAARRWTSWHRWATLALLVHAFLTVTPAVEHAPTPAATGKFR